MLEDLLTLSFSPCCFLFFSFFFFFLIKTRTDNIFFLLFDRKIRQELPTCIISFQKNKEKQQRERERERERGGGAVCSLSLLSD